ncbi:MAG: HD domain-containing protein [Candidatus Adiutrix sp.]|jgi:putative nucleotidyltransferase with HDIG domain|nr:HD domain-containing protein [Candidatus Adiutrix sp.]
MHKTWLELFPEIEWIKDGELREKTIRVNQEALEIGGFQPADLDKLPFTLLIPNNDVSYRTHVRAITHMLDSVYKDYGAFYGAYPLNYDYLIAGGILHDVGKIVEYQQKADGGFEKSPIGKLMRHPFSGAGLAVKHGLPWEISHIIATHAAEGDGGYRTPEAVLIYKIDTLNFMSLKAFKGMI